MQHINAGLKNYLPQRGSEGKPNNTSGNSMSANAWSARTERLVAALWTRMSQLYRHKWNSSEGELKMENGQMSENFKLWCRKLDHLSDQDFARGFEQLEYLLKEAGREGRELWPPSYAEFIGYSEKPIGAAVAAYKTFAPGLPEPKEHRHKRRKLGMDKCSEILGMLK